MVNGSGNSLSSRGKLTTKILSQTTIQSQIQEVGNIPRGKDRQYRHKNRQIEAGMKNCMPQQSGESILQNLKQIREKMVNEGLNAEKIVMLEIILEKLENKDPA